MPRGRPTPQHLAAEAQALYEAGVPHQLIQQQTGLPHGTVSEIIYRTTPLWAKLHDTEAFRQVRQEQKRVLQAALIEITRQAAVQIERTLPDASARDAAVVLGIVSDKERLIAGEPTEHIAIMAQHELIALDALAQRLSVELLRRSAEAREATGAGGDGGGRRQLSL